MDKPSYQFVKPYSKGQITIPLEFRRFLDIDEETWLHLSVQGKKIVIEPIRRKEGEDAKYQTSEEKFPSVDQEEYKLVVKDAKGKYGEKIVEENEKVRKEIEERLEKLGL